MDCFEAVQEFIRGQRDLLAWTHFESIPKPETSYNQTNGSEEELKSRKAVIAEQKKQKLIKYQQDNIRTVNEMSDWIRYMREHNILAGRFDADYFGVKTFLAIRRKDEDAPLANRLAKNKKYSHNHTFAYRFLNEKVSGGMCITIPTYKTLKYRFIALGDLDNFYLRNDEIIQPLLEIIENIPFIQEPLVKAQHNDK